MTLPIVDLSMGRLRLDADQFQALMMGLGSPFVARPGASEAAWDDAWNQLVRAGIVDSSGRPAAVFAAPFEALVAPILVAKVDLVGTQGASSHDLWVGSRTGVVAAQVKGPQYEIIPIASTGTAAAISRLSGLSPRLRPVAGEKSIRVPASALTELSEPPTHAQSIALGQKIDCWPRISAEVSAGDWRQVRWAMDWAPSLFGDSTRNSSTSIILESPSGYLWITPGTGELVLEQVTPTDIWQRLAELASPPSSILSPED